MSTARRRATYEDLLAVPEHLVAEIIDGELIVSPRPSPKHAVACSAIVGQLNGPLNGPPPELHFGDDVLVPDVAGWRRERMPTVPETAFFPLAPDWVCEVVSPSSGRLDRVRKMPVYARQGVGHVWLVGPLARTLEVFRLERDAPARIRPFEVIGVDPRRWWVDA